jgi:GNAT superfamily N-acetyltransferase
VLKELFVGPAFRRRGYATLIEAQAAAIARTWRPARMEAYLHSADALIGNRVAGRAFGLRASYQWRWR